jgi:Sugar kinases, ribokinase family
LRRYYALPKIVALGEPMVQFNALSNGPLRHVNLFEKHVAGSEANFCAHAVRTGSECALIARVGKDEFGATIMEWLRGVGVDIRHIKVDRDAPTAVYFVQRNFPVPYRTEMFYYRKGSAGSRLNPEDVDHSLITTADLIHSSGITLAISLSAREAVFKAFEKAKSTSFDTNVRLKLWSAEEARETILKLMPDIGLLITDREDSKVLFGVSEFPEVVKRVSEYPVRVLLFKEGPKGATVFREGEVVRVPGYSVPVEDVLGAGDAMAGTFVSLYIQGFEIKEALSYAVAAASLKVTVRGDQTATPDLEEIKKFLLEYKPGE